MRESPDTGISLWRERCQLRYRPAWRRTRAGKKGAYAAIRDGESIDGCGNTAKFSNLAFAEIDASIQQRMMNDATEGLRVVVEEAIDMVEPVSIQPLSSLHADGNSPNSHGAYQKKQSPAFSSHARDC